MMGLRENLVPKRVLKSINLVINSDLYGIRTGKNDKKALRRAGQAR